MLGAGVGAGVPPVSVGAGVNAVVVGAGVGAPTKPPHEAELLPVLLVTLLTTAHAV